MKPGENILVTGAGGCIGSALARRFARSDAERLILLDHSEHELYEIDLALDAVEGGVPHTAIVGDVCDAGLLAEVFEQHRPTRIYHAAAFKHVPMMERNPLAAIRNNVFGTLAMARAAHEYKAAQLVMVSTDKAVNPRSLMGVSKRIAELILLRWSSAGTQMKAVRLGNVLGSRGSVVPLFVKQIARGSPVTVTHPQVRRYFVSLSEAVDIICAVGDQQNGRMFVAEVGKPVKIADLARQLIDDAGFDPAKGRPIAFTELRPGEKLDEEMVFANETAEPTGDQRIRRVQCPQIDTARFDADVAELQESVERRDLSASLEMLVRIVPEYEPSKLLLSQVALWCAAIKCETK
jgi:FlaA1/EpsC-like NDP-sugar epimerase